MNTYNISVRAFGIHAVLIEWPNRVDEAILNDILGFADYLKDQKLDANQWEMVPAYNSLTLIQRKTPVNFDRFKEKIKQWYTAKKIDVQRKKMLWRLPVCYNEEFGIDLNDVSERSGLSVNDIIQLHTNGRYTVFGIGFLPGFMYLGGP